MFAPSDSAGSATIFGSCTIIHPENASGSNGLGLAGTGDSVLTITGVGFGGEDCATVQIPAPSNAAEPTTIAIQRINTLPIQATTHRPALFRRYLRLCHQPISSLTPATPERFVYQAVHGVSRGSQRRTCCR